MTDQALSPSPKRPFLWIALGCCALCCCGGVVWFLLYLLCGILLVESPAKLLEGMF